MICLFMGDACGEARTYYYDWLTDAGPEELPVSVRDHIGSCDFCQQELARLSGLLEAEAPAGTGEDGPDPLVRLLTLHFSHLGEAVTCSSARPFLPTLADSHLGLQVMTPITRHVAACSACQRETEAIAALELTTGQLLRAGQFLAAASRAGAVVGPAGTEAVADLRIDDLDADTVVQVCVSSTGRTEVQKRLAEHAARLPAEPPLTGALSCAAITNADLFEYALPYGRDPQVDDKRGFRETLTEHVRHCRTCLGRVQSLQGLFFGMAERADTPVVTVMELSDEAVACERSRRVRVVPRHVVVSPWVRSLAAVLLLVVALLITLRATRATAFDLGDLRTALGNVPALHAVKLAGSSGRIIEEIWGRPNTGQWLIDQEETATLWDLQARRHVLWDKQSGDVTSGSIPDRLLVDLKAQQAGLFGLLPAAGRLPSGSHWEPVEEAASGASEEVWELRLPYTSRQGTEAWQKRVYHVDAETHRPRLLEFYRPGPSGNGLDRLTATRISYPQDLDLAGQLKALGLSVVPGTTE